MAKTQVRSTYKHIEFLDVTGDGNGALKEVAVVKKWAGGAVSYIDVGLLDNIDKARLKRIVIGQHADKYELYELLSMATLSNGLNGLEYFHQLTKVKKGKGTIDRTPGGSLADVSTAGRTEIIGSEFTNPSEAQIDGASQPGPRQI